jgi:peptide/nickel transport system substrate-binding protein
MMPHAPRQLQDQSGALSARSRDAADVFSTRTVPTKAGQISAPITKVTKAEATDARTVRFDLSALTTPTPLIIGLMPVLARAKAADAATLERSFTLVGSGPYTVSNVKPGESVTFTRDKNYWGRDLAINRGLWNFDTIRYDYYRDGNTHFEAFKKGLYDLRVETDPGRWQTAYDFPAMRDGRVVKEDLPYGLPKGMQGLVFNTRRAIFSDVRVREAILQLFDFEWLNRTYFFSLYKRTASYFDGCDLSAHGVPANVRERELLTPFPGVVRADIMEGAWSPPATDGSGHDRSVLRRAFGAARAASYGSRDSGCCIPRPDSLLRSKSSPHARRARCSFIIAISKRCLHWPGRVRVRRRNTKPRIAFDYDASRYRWGRVHHSRRRAAICTAGAHARRSTGATGFFHGGRRSELRRAMISAMLGTTSRGTSSSPVLSIGSALRASACGTLYFPPHAMGGAVSQIAHPYKRRCSAVCRKHSGGPQALKALYDDPQARISQASDRTQP